MAGCSCPVCAVDVGRAIDGHPVRAWSDLLPGYPRYEVLLDVQLRVGYPLLIKTG
jgi:hypothetical protein